MTGRLYRLIFVGGDEIPTGAEVVTDPKRVQDMRDWFAHLQQTVDAHGPTAERTVLVRVPYPETAEKA